MKLGAEPRKLALLAALMGVLAVVGYRNFSSVERQPPVVPGNKQGAATFSRTAAPTASAPPTRPLLREFRPSLKLDQREQRLDPASIDPTLRLDLLERVRAVALAGGARNLFQFGPAPAPPKPEPKVIPKPTPAAEAPAAPQPAESLKPPPPPIPLKFFGYVAPSRAGQKRGLFLDGDDIIVAGEGELVKKRYKVLRIGLNSVVVEDVELKHQQTLILEEPS